MRLQVKYGLIKLLSTTADLCEQVENVDMKCPIKAGETTVSKTVEMPEQIPQVCSVFVCAATLLTSGQGKYDVIADVYTADDEPIVCLAATVVF